ncbi:membrane progestin receptor delta-like [Sycon ciliatum]|uniref:membrane progestin receptor delta-like n=1 Tax=Sycon ciliatum TaxID=27933 RepID=UPI0031F6C5E0
MAPPPPRLTRLLKVRDAAKVLHENFLIRGYRPLGIGYVDTMRSCTTWLSNETVNVWTHLLPGLYFLHESWKLFNRAEGFGSANGAAHYLPLAMMLLGTGVVLVTSSLAHCFNCMSARARHTCFFCDYGAIGFYSLCSGLAHYYLCGIMPSDEPNATGEWLLDTGLFQPWVFVPLLVTNHFLIFIVMCLTRHHWQPMRYIVRTLGYVVAFTVNMFPFWARLFLSTSNVFSTTSLTNHFWQYFWNLLAALSNMSKCPERFFPGYFDIVGHSHQWMHVFLTFSLLQEHKAIQIDIETRLSEFPLTPTVGAVVLVPLVFAAVSVFVIVRARRMLQEDGSLRKARKSS